jgi:hypothetical protein
LDKSLSIIKNAKAADKEYWTAAVYENYAYIYKDLGLAKDCDAYLDKSLAIYRKIISQTDGSPIPLGIIKDKIDSLDYTKINNKPNTQEYKVILNLDNQKLKELPNNLPNNIENLSASGNRIHDISSLTAEFLDLKYLNLSDNRIRNANIDFKNVSNLVWLNLSKNKLRSLKADLSSLTQLDFLDLSYNSLKDIPNSIMSLKSLKVLNLKGNKIPFEQISNIIRALPNTNILYDEYIIKGEESEQE